MDSVVVLAGGASKRMGRDKMLLEIGGVTMLESVVARFREEFEDVFISVADEAKYPEVKARRIVDIRRGAGPLSGLHAALAGAVCDGVFLVAADLPYASPKAAKRIIELCSGYNAGVIKLPGGMIEPLFGYYKKALLPLCEEALKSGDYRMSEILYNANTRFISQEELGGLWEERIIYNINYPEDYTAMTLTCSHVDDTTTQPLQPKTEEGAPGK